MAIIIISCFVVTDRRSDEVECDRVCESCCVDGKEYDLRAAWIGLVDSNAAARSSGCIRTHGPRTDAIVDGTRQVQQVADQRQPVLFTTIGRHRRRRHRRVKRYDIFQHQRVRRRRKVGHG